MGTKTFDRAPVDLDDWQESARITIVRRRIIFSSYA
jgi:hypothetical protein